MMPNELHPHKHTVSPADRSALKGHRPLVLWLTGLSGSGKSTIANALEFQLVHTYRAHTFLLDGDNIRTGLNAGLGFSEQDRKENIRRVGEVARLMFDAGLIVMTAFISPYRADRDMVRSLFQPGSFWEIYTACPLEVCQQRDPKGLYQKAIAGQIVDFTGIGAPYEVPLHPEIQINTDQEDVDRCVETILSRMLSMGILTPPA